MKAPICVVCKKWASVWKGTGDWVQFKVNDPKEIEYNELLNQPDRPPGHRFGNWFFCIEHLEIGHKYKHLTWKEAEPLIKKEFRNDEVSEPKKSVGGNAFKRLFGLFKKS